MSSCNWQEQRLRQRTSTTQFFERASDSTTVNAKYLGEENQAPLAISDDAFYPRSCFLSETPRPHDGAFLGFGQLCCCLGSSR